MHSQSHNYILIAKKNKKNNKRITQNYVNTYISKIIELHKKKG